MIQHRHPYEDVRDTSLYYPIRQLVNVKREGEYPGLKTLATKILNRDIQKGEHCPVSRSQTQHCTTVG